MENNLDSLFHALSDPTRRAVLNRLGVGPARVSDLAAPFPMALPSFLKHVTVLEDAGLITSSKSGRVRLCTLQPDRFALAEAWFADQRDVWASRFQNLDDLITRQQGEDDEK